MRYSLLIWLFVGFSCFAESSNLKVCDVGIKQAGQNSLIAKQKALHNSARKAFDRVINRDFREFSSYAEYVSTQQIQNCIYDYSIKHEKFSNSFYIADFSYRFSADKIAEALNRFGANIKRVSHGKFVYVGIYRDDFVNNADALQQIEVEVVRFSSVRVVLKVFDLDKFKQLNIDYVELQEHKI